MKKILLFITLILSTVLVKAQTQLAFPFQGGSPIMARFLKTASLYRPKLLKGKQPAQLFSSLLLMRKGDQKIIIYYADDSILAPPIIEALRKSNHKWIIPDHEKLHDFVLPFTISYNPPANASNATIKAAFDYYSKRKPIMSYNQIPIETATLLPAVTVSYDLGE